jgi:Fe-S cluster assembly protein SufA/iron-sulfur cluster assembly protein
LNNVKEFNISSHLIEVTEEAKLVIESTINSDVFIHFCADNAGCNGFKYIWEKKILLDEDQSEYFFVEWSNQKFIGILKKDLGLLKGTIIGYNKTKFEENFTFENPNVANNCGCGESFSVS